MTQAKPPAPALNATERLKQVQEAQTRANSAEIERAYDDLFNATKSPNPRLPKHLFDGFLPYFTGKIQDDEKLNITTNWIGVAGSPQTEVDVVNEKNEVLFTVPPLMSSDFMRPGTRHGPSFTEILQHAREQSMRIPELGNRALVEGTAAKIDAMNPAPQTQHERAWGKIFDFYGVEAPGLKTAKETEKQKTNGSEDLLFDE